MRLLLPIAIGVVFIAAVAAKADDSTLQNAADDSPPREIQPTLLPSYRVKAPDILDIKLTMCACRLPRLPNSYRIAISDVLQIRVTGTILEQPIDGYFLVEGKGVVTLGPAYGRVNVANMTIEEANRAITKSLRFILKEPKVSVQLARTREFTPVDRDYFVESDGTINLQLYGKLQVSGKTLEEIRLDLERHLAKWFVSPEVSVNVRHYNDKVYYIVTEGDSLENGIRRVPITGKDTIKEALDTVKGLTLLPKATVWVARPGQSDSASEQILRVDYQTLIHGKASAKNFQILPRDRIFVREEPVPPGSKTMPIMGRSYNRTRY